MSLSHTAWSARNPSKTTVPPQGGTPSIGVPMEKTCTKCGATKPLEHFGRLAKSPDGHAWECKVCSRARSKARYDSMSPNEKANKQAGRSTKRSPGTTKRSPKDDTTRTDANGISWFTLPQHRSVYRAGYYEIPIFRGHSPDRPCVCYYRMPGGGYSKTGPCGCGPLGPKFLTLSEDTNNA